MKKNLLVLAALSVVALPFLFSCGKPNDPDQPAEVIIMQDPPTKDAAKLVVFPAENLPKYEDTQGEYEIIQIEFTEASRYLLKRRVIATKANVGDIQMITGKFTESAGNYNCQGFGSVNVSGSGSNANVSVKPDGAENKKNEYSGSANVKDTPAPSSQDQKNATRVWKVDNTVLTVSKGNKTIESGFKGCDLYQMAQYAYDNNVDIDVSKFTGYSVTEINITGNKTFTISFAGQPSFYGECEMGSNNTIRARLTVANEFFNNGSLSGVYKFPADKKMNLTFDVDIKGYAGKIDLLLSQN